MPKTKFIVSLLTFSFLLFFTSVIKNKTRVIEKKIILAETNINNLKQSLNESQIDFFYLTSPKILKEKLQFLTSEEYEHMKFSKIYLDYESFIKSQKNLSKK